MKMVKPMLRLISAGDSRSHVSKEGRIKSYGRNIGLGTVSFVAAPAMSDITMARSSDRAYRDKKLNRVIVNRRLTLELTRARRGRAERGPEERRVERVVGRLM